MEVMPARGHVHFYGFYLGNYPTLEQEKILGCATCSTRWPRQRKGRFR